MLPILTEDNIRLNVTLENKIDAICLAGNILERNGYVTKQYIDYMLLREEVVSVYIGNHLAIPHGVENSEAEILSSGISVVQVPDGVSFGENQIAYMVIGIAGKEGTHMDILSKIAIVCSDEENVERMRRARSKKEILDILGDI